MSNEEIQVNIRFRDILIEGDARLVEITGDGGFLATVAPMPVGTVLVLSPPDAPDIEVLAHVTSVREAISGQAARRGPGMRILFEAGGEALMAHARSPGAPGAGQDTAARATDGTSGSGPHEAGDEAAETRDDAAEEPAEETRDEAAEGAANSEHPEEPPAPGGPSPAASTPMDSALVPHASGEIDLGAFVSNSKEHPERHTVIVDVVECPEMLLDHSEELEELDDLDEEETAVERPSGLAAKRNQASED